MLLIWLLFIQSAAAWTFDCRGSCGLCTMQQPGTIACTLCRECKNSQNQQIIRRKRSPVSRKKKDEEENDLKEMERKEFRQVMKEYGLKPEDLADSNEGKEESTEEKNDPEYNSNQCIGTNECLDKEIVSYSGKLRLVRKKKPQTKKIPTTSSHNECSTSPAPAKDCPVAKPCKKRLVNLDDGQDTSTSSTLTLAKLLRQLTQLSSAGKELEDKGGPPQPNCSDEEEQDYEEPVTKISVDTTTTATTTATTKTCSKKRMQKLAKTSTTSCIPCMPYCQLPCALPFPQIPQLPFVPAAIPQEVLQALLTLKPVAVTEKPAHVESSTKEEKEIETKEDQQSNEDEQSKEEMQDEITKGSTKRHTKKSTKRTTEESTEKTTKEYIYLYIGVPKGDKNVPRG